MRLKEADAFQRLVFATGRVCPRQHLLASKKQTPFSVWYSEPLRCTWDGTMSLKEADAFQRLVSAAARRLWSRTTCLKEADAFQRLVCARTRLCLCQAGGAASKKQTPFSVWYSDGRFNPCCAPDGLKEADAFQRLVCPAACRCRPSNSCLKEADAFQRLV